MIKLNEIEKQRIRGCLKRYRSLIQDFENEFPECGVEPQYEKDKKRIEKLLKLLEAEPAIERENRRIKNYKMKQEKIICS